jgi:hypothetical protein
MDRLFKQEQEIFSIGLDETAKAYLLETARWAKFLAIFFFIVSAILVALGIGLALVLGNSADFGNPMLTAMGGFGLAVIYIFFIGIYVYPMWALFKFAKLTNAAMQTANQQQFNEALKYQKNMFKYMGILMIIVMALYGVSFVLGLLGALMSGGA